MPLDDESREAIAREIEVAFSDVNLSEGIGLYEAWSVDCYADAHEQGKARRRDERHDWKLISNDEIEGHYSALCFVDTSGFRFLIPAFMRYTVCNYDTSDSVSVDSTIYALDGGWASAPGFVESLTERQAVVIAKFLRQMILDVGEDWVDAVAASRAYENYWKGYDEAA